MHGVRFFFFANHKKKCFFLYFFSQKKGSTFCRNGVLLDAKLFFEDRLYFLKDDLSLYFPYNHFVVLWITSIMVAWKTRLSFHAVRIERFFTKNSFFYHFMWIFRVWRNLCPSIFAKHLIQLTFVGKIESNLFVKILQLKYWLLKIQKQSQNL